MDLSGFDSEADRRYAIRTHIVAVCTNFIVKTIEENAITNSIVERRYLMVTIARRLLSMQMMEAQTQLFGEEVHATQEAEGDLPKV